MTKTESHVSVIDSSLPPTITRPDFIPFTLRYLCSNAPYDYKPGGFRDFPQRQGWDLRGEPGKPEKSKFVLLDPTDPPPELADRVAFLQAWMFFGVLVEASSIYGLEIDIESEFISNTEGGKVVSTEPLNRLPARWLRAADSYQNRKDRYSRIWELCQYLECRIFNLREEGTKTRLFTYDECEALLSIEILYRSLLVSLSRSGEYGAATLRPLLKSKFFDYQLKLHRKGWRGLQKQGWCHSEMKMLSALNRELPYAFFATTLRRYPMDHSDCSDFRCVADHINENTYRIMHADNGCQCDLAYANVDQLCSILSDSDVPIILVSQDLQIQVVRDLPFVAISHVWSHGMGNPRENAIPSCQLRRIRDSISNLDENFHLGLRSNNENSYAFWLDTLCIPVASNLKAYRKQAIGLMGRTYRDATTVLVLDRELRNLDPRTTTLLEQSLWLVFSGWMRRLWTLQEAALAHDLFIEMKDGPNRYSRLEDGGILSANKWKRARLGPIENDIMPEILLYRELELLIQRRIPLAQHLQEMSQDVEHQTPYQYLCAATERRCTSKSNDEPLILATMMGQNVARVLMEEDDEDRMAIWHQEMRVIPAEIIFIHENIKRLSKAPFRWAPASLMENEIATPLYRGIGTCDSDGLHVQYAGYILSDFQECRAMNFEDKWYLHDRENGTVHKIRHNMNNRLPRKCAILFDLEFRGDGAVAEILDQQTRGVEITYIITMIGCVAFYKKLGMGPDKSIKPGRDVINCRRTSPTQQWCVT